MFFGERPTLRWVAKRILITVAVALAVLAVKRQFAPSTHLEVQWRVNPQGEMVIDRTAIVSDPDDCSGAAGRLTVEPRC